MSQHRRLTRSLLLLPATLLLGPWTTGSLSAQQPPDGASPTSFFKVGAELATAGDSGTVIRARRIDDGARLPGSRTWQVLYRSSDVTGAIRAVSGTIAVPGGRPPAGGWPVLSWAHGTTGVADKCAPSRDAADHPSHDYLSVTDATLRQWIARGYAVLRTDYHGLGTRGPHGYMIGVPEARAVTDIVRAAREVVPGLSRQWVAAGHSQGGTAAMFVGELGQQMAPDLDLLGVVSLAPGSNYGEAIKAFRRVPQGNAALMALLIRGARTVADLDLRSMLTPRALELMSHTRDRCIAQMRQPDSWGGVTNGEVFRQDADTTDFDRVIDRNDPRYLKPSVPVYLLHGGQDEAAPFALSTLLLAEYQAAGVNIDHSFYPTADHRGVIAESDPDVAAWVAERFAEHR